MYQSREEDDESASPSVCVCVAVLCLARSIYVLSSRRHMQPSIRPWWNHGVGDIARFAQEDVESTDGSGGRADSERVKLPALEDRGPVCCSNGCDFEACRTRSCGILSEGHWQ